MKISPVNNNFYRQNFKANYSKENNVVILGSSKTTPQILQDMALASELTSYLVQTSGKNVLTGCGSKGIMGAAYYAAAASSKRNEDDKPEQNAVILKHPLWGDEDLESCVTLGTADSEAARIEKFIETADFFVIFPGGPGTMQEASTLISNNYYNKENKKQVVLVNSDFFKGLDDQYKQMEEKGLLPCKRSELYTITDDIDSITKVIN